MNKVTRFVGEILLELSRVRWPGQNELFIYTLVVMFTVAVMAVILSAMDAGLGYLVKMFLAI